MKESRRGDGPSSTQSPSLVAIARLNVIELLQQNAFWKKKLILCDIFSHVTIFYEKNRNRRIDLQNKTMNTVLGGDIWKLFYLQIFCTESLQCSVENLITWLQLALAVVRSITTFTDIICNISVKASLRWGVRLENIWDLLRQWTIRSEGLITRSLLLTWATLSCRCWFRTGLRYFDHLTPDTWHSPDKTTFYCSMNRQQRLLLDKNWART